MASGQTKQPTSGPQYFPEPIDSTAFTKKNMYNVFLPNAVINSIPRGRYKSQTCTILSYLKRMKMEYNVLTFILNLFNLWR